MDRTRRPSRAANITRAISGNRAQLSSSRSCDALHPSGDLREFGSANRAARRHVPLGSCWLIHIIFGGRSIEAGDRSDSSSRNDASASCNPAKIELAVRGARPRICICACCSNCNPAAFPASCTACSIPIPWLQLRLPLRRRNRTWLQRLPQASRMMRACTPRREAHPRHPLDLPLLRHPSRQPQLVQLLQRRIQSRRKPSCLQIQLRRPLLAAR